MCLYGGGPRCTHSIGLHGIGLAATRVILYDGGGQTGLDVDGAWLVERLQLEKEIIRRRRVTTKVEEKRENKNVERELKEDRQALGNSTVDGERLLLPLFIIVKPWLNKSLMVTIFLSCWSQYMMTCYG